QDDDVGGEHAVRCRHLDHQDVGEVAERLPGVDVIGGVALAVHDEDLAARPPALQQLHRPLRLPLLEGGEVHHHDAALAGSIAQGSLEGQGAGLLRQAEGVVAGLRPVGDPATHPLRLTDGAMAGPAGPLLAPGLAPAAADLGPGLRRVGTRPDGGKVGPDHRVHDRDVGFDIEDLVGQRDRAGVGTLTVDVGGEAHRDVAPLARTEERTSTRQPFGPGTAPRMRRRLRLGSASTISRLRMVTRPAPSWPPIFIPLKMRDGVALAPTEPGERCLRSVPWLEERPLKPWRRMTPEKPLHSDLATTSTRSPLAKTSARISWPSSKPPVVVSRTSTRWRIGGRDRVFK